ncbi:MAG: PPC domain-containing DNA-binding protein [Actinomycetota bacterium]|nr:DUF296 domain-containing protein [Actinomycetota bacterium]
MHTTELKHGRTWLIRLDTDAPLYKQILDAGAELGIEAATFTLIGALQNVVVRYVDQEAKEYRDLELNQHMEMLSGVGNFSLKDGKPFVHCHITVAAEDGSAYGGHLHEEKPSLIFVTELWLQELLGDAPVRLFDERCGLALWQ